jgi:hypothetical protein
VPELPVLAAQAGVVQAVKVQSAVHFPVKQATALLV